MIFCILLEFVSSDAAGNFYAPLSGLSFNAYKSVMEIDALGTFNTSKVAFHSYLRVSVTVYWQ